MSAAKNLSEIEVKTLSAFHKRGQLSEQDIDDAVDLSRKWRARLPDVLSAMFRVSNYEWAQQMAESCDMPFADLQKTLPEPGLVIAADRADYLQHLFLPWCTDPDGALIIAANNPADKTLRALMQMRYPGRTIRYAVTGKFDVIWAIQKLFDNELSMEAREALYNREPELSAKTTFSTKQVIFSIIFVFVVLLGLTWNGHAMLVILLAAVSALYAVLFVFRGILTIIGSGRRVDLSVSDSEIAGLKDVDLPVFTVLVPMYKESEVLPILVASIRNLDYPRAKLDVKLVLESGDHETINAARALGAEDLFEIIRVPDSQPKTKPKACNYALYFARGTYTVIFDAEDIPESNQLKKVVALFRSSPKNVACIQARLNYFNRDDNFLTRMFTLEYSHWFDYLLPGLHKLNIPIPLGGTSNHFRTDVLRSLGAWDPYNVTEDADLGVRLTQAGYRVAVVNSTTFEEANGVFKSWINQRSRWIKGYMQTWLVHMRRPIQLYRRLGLVGFLGFQMFIGFPPFTALINPLFWLTSLVALLAGPGQVETFFPPAVLWLALFNLLISNAMYIYFNLVAASKRQWFNLVPWGLLAPVYWVLHSVAAYKALGQLITNPHYWEKTQHGTSAQTREKVAALSAGEHKAASGEIA